jgi:hypothetical protein
LEVLIALTIVGVSMTLLWQTKNNQAVFNETLHKKFANERLEHDRAILKHLGLLTKIDLEGY